MYLIRGQPVVYYGDEQGFVGDGGDKDARQDMFAVAGRRVQRRRPDRHRRHDGDANFDTDHPLYQHLADLSAAARRSTRRSPTAPRSTATPSGSAGIYAFSRIDADDQRRVRRRR